MYLYCGFSLFGRPVFNVKPFCFRSFVLFSRFVRSVFEV